MPLMLTGEGSVFPVPVNEPEPERPLFSARTVGLGRGSGRRDVLTAIISHRLLCEETVSTRLIRIRRRCSTNGVLRQKRSSVKP